MNTKYARPAATFLLLFLGIVTGYVLGSQTHANLQYREYIIQVGDTCAKIAYELRVSQFSIVETNESLKEEQCHYIYVGQKLKIPHPNLPPIEQYNKIGIGGCEKINYTKGIGDEPYQVALKFNTTIEILEELNDLNNISYYSLDKIIVPICTATSTP